MMWMAIGVGCTIGAAGIASFLAGYTVGRREGVQEERRRHG